MQKYAVSGQDAYYYRLSGLFRFMSVGMVVIFIVMILLLIWSVVINWRIFKKAGQPGWKALIPVYDVITIHRIIRSSKGSLIIYGILMASCVIFYFLGMGLPTAFLVIYYMSLYYRMAKYFGKSVGFAVGCAFLWPIFGAILAFSKDPLVELDEESEEDEVQGVAQAQAETQPEAQTETQTGVQPETQPVQNTPVQAVDPVVAQQVNPEPSAGPETTVNPESSNDPGEGMQPPVQQNFFAQNVQGPNSSENPFKK